SARASRIPMELPSANHLRRINYQDLLDCGSTSAAKEKGLVRIEGKEYVVQDGDVILFRFNV
ncbi:MAG: DUF933 domain-containing protein, partial [Lachnoanaerobaculum gingivalis]